MRGINGFKAIKTDTLPDEIFNRIVEANGFKYHGSQWLFGYAFQRNDNKEFIVVTNDGGYYKVHAQFMIWHVNQNNVVCSQACWTLASMRRSMKSLLNGTGTVFDPNYQT